MIGDLMNLVAVEKDGAGHDFLEWFCREQVEDEAAAQLIVADTMDHWILNDRQNVLAMLKRIDGLVLNDSEAKLLTGDENLVRTGHSVLKLGPRFVVIKKGEHGAMFFSEQET